MMREPENEVTEMWRASRREQQARRSARLPRRRAEILALAAEHGYAVRRLTDYQFRVNGRLDLFPIHRRWFDIANNTRGTYSTALAIVLRKIGKVNS